MASTLLCNSVNSSTAVFSRTHFPALVSKDFPVEFSPYVHCNYYCKTRKQKRKLAQVKAKLAEASPTVPQPTQSGGEPLKKLRILVAGGGIGGLVFALAAKKKGFDVVVFEKDMSAIRGEGQYRGPIQIQSNALAALEAIDLEVADEVMKAGCITGDRINGLVDGVSGTWYVKFDTFTPAAERGLPVTRVISRMTLQQILARAVGEDIIINGSNVVDFEDNGDKVTVMLENGQSFAGDLLVGADGIWSKVRKSLFGPNEAIYSGYTCYTGTESFWDTNNTSFLQTWVQERCSGKKERLLKIFEGWCDNVMDLILATDEDAILRRDIYDRTPILTWGKGRVTLLGDSVHAMQPNLGQGGCMAIEDGYQLALELNKSWKQSIEEGTPIDILSSLKRYENSRRLRVAIIHGMARMAALMASTYKAYLGVGLGPLSFLTKFRIPHPGRVGGRVFIDLGMPLMLSWVLGGNSSGLEGRSPSCRLSDKASDQLRQWFEDDDALERTINGEWFLLPCGNETGALQPICLSRDESKPCIIGSIAHQDIPGMSIAIPLPQVSEMHARVSYKEGAFFLTDLRSEHGTWLADNEERRYRVPPNFPTRFRPSDVIEFGPDKKAAFRVKVVRSSPKIAEESGILQTV
ncbi:zeaxanthin epoxidase, chloroplastic isoform X2 [Corylus avellana]|uniref:zeaxanthin epoxidase, chloroplastic isoform X2 n=1 Tax=Corylus avellana TaxID=13451 RepID=UPI00286BBD17|nr:zeaxanthin epoxidase, chloroplastic isoform X2 [Corylus avellana]